MESLEEVRKVQRLAYESLIETRKLLHEGMTEKEACALIEKFFQEKGQKLFFHRPFAWFGDRTNFTNFNRPRLPKKGELLPHLGKEFLPTERRLQKGMPVTLDVAPAVNGLAVDIGYSFSFGENAEVEKARRHLKELRSLILKIVKEKSPINRLYDQVENMIINLGYKNCHDLYPLGVLGHRIGKLPLMKLPRVSIMGFHPQAYLYLLKEMALGSALLTKDETRPLSPGLWAVEPHLGAENYGVKFEEILVVTENDAFWLDDELPHMTELS
jgi:Xaa-Pro aminopeptidase